MARKRRNGHKPDIVTKIFKGIFKAGSKLLVSSPITIPAVAAAQHVMAGGTDPAQAFVFEATGYSLQNKGLDQNKLKDVIVRDLVLVGFGLGLRWAGRHV